MAWLNHAGMVRADDGNAVSGTSVSTFLDNHDNAKNSAQWITKDWKLGYAYILTHEGRPCVFYNHFYGVAEQDWENGHPEISVTPPAALKTDIKQLMFIRKTYLGGGLVVLSEVGNPYPSGDTYNVYVARRQGNGTKNGAIVVLNNNDSQTKGLWVNTYATGYSTWAGKVLKNALTGTTVTVQADGRVWVEAPARGYAVYVISTDYVAYVQSKVTSKTAKDNLTQDNFRVNIYPNPIASNSVISILTQSRQDVTITVYDAIGKQITQIYSGMLDEGTHEFLLNDAIQNHGTYFVRIKAGDELVTKPVVY